MKTYKSAAVLTTILALVFLCACAGGAPPQSPPSGDASGVEISFEFNRQSGYASNQFAVWIEDGSGNFIKTLYATRYTSNGGYKQRPDSIPQWVERSGLANMDSVDAITGPTPQSGAVSYIWDCTDANGAPVPAGIYKFFIEGSLRWKNRVLYSGAIEVGGEASDIESLTIQPFYEGSDDQPALDMSAEENNMIQSVTAKYVP